MCLVSRIFQTVISLFKGFLMPRRANRQRKASRLNIPAPVGGWDTTTDIASMAPDTAIRLDNVISDTGLIRKRGGWTSTSVGFGTPMDGIVGLHAADTGIKPYLVVMMEDFRSSSTGGFASGPHLDAEIIMTSAKKTGNANVQPWVRMTGFGLGAMGSAYNQSAYVTSGVPIAATFNGRTVIVCEGVLGGAIWPVPLGANGTASATATTLAFTASALPDSSAIAELSYVHAYKGRLYFARRNKKGFYYLPLNAVQGSAEYFDVGQVADPSGELYIITSWTRDGGDGPDDYLVLIYSEGDIIVYQGSDPTSITDWAIVGRYKVGRPLSRRSAVNVGGQIILQTEEDFITLPDALTLEGVSPPTKLSGAAKFAAKKYTGIATNNTSAQWDTAYNKYWQAHYSPAEGLVIHNVPISVSTSALLEGIGFSSDGSAGAGILRYFDVESEQYVVNVRTGGPSRWTNIRATCWEDFQGTLMFGTGKGDLGRYGVTASDGKDKGDPIPIHIETAYIAGDAEEKRVTSYRPRIRIGGTSSEIVSSGTGFDIDANTFRGNTAVEWASGSGEGMITWVSADTAQAGSFSYMVDSVYPIASTSVDVQFSVMYPATSKRSTYPNIGIRMYCSASGDVGSETVMRGGAEMWLDIDTGVSPSDLFRAQFRAYLDTVTVATSAKILDDMNRPGQAPTPILLPHPSNDAGADGASNAVADVGYMVQLTRRGNTLAAWGRSTTNDAYNSLQKIGSCDITGFESAGPYIAIMFSPTASGIKSEYITDVYIATASSLFVAGSTFVQGDIPVETIRTKVNYDFSATPSAQYTTYTVANTGVDDYFQPPWEYNSRGFYTNVDVFSNYGQGEYVSFSIETSTSAQVWEFEGINVDITKGGGFV